MPLIVPDRLHVKLRYSDIYTVTNTVGSVSYQRWRGNSVFDPDQTGAGTQPSGFDQWSAFYQNYVVHGSALTVRVVNSDASSGSINKQDWYYGLCPTAFATGTEATVQDWAEQPYAKVRFSGTYNLDAREQTIKSYMSSAKMFGVPPRSIVADVTYSALVTANPANQWYWNFFMVPWDLASTTGGFAAVVMVYYVTFYGRVLQSHS